VTVLDRLEAFRDLIRHGNALLGEVVVYCRQAESAVTQLASDKQEVDRMRTELEAARERAGAEADAARAAMAQVDVQRRELEAMRAELIKARTDMEAVQRGQSRDAEALESSLRQAKEQQVRLEDELTRVRAQAASSKAMHSRLAQLDGIQARLRTTELELAETRLALENERSRRDRAIALIKPKQVDEVRS
jgi:predicted  nucleic acid-binding Zn-ribbon protein